MLELVALEIKFEPFDIEAAVIASLLTDLRYSWLNAPEMPYPGGRNLNVARQRQRGIHNALAGLADSASAEWRKGPRVEIEGTKCHPHVSDVGSFSTQNFTGKFVTLKDVQPDTILLFVRPNDPLNPDREIWQPLAQDEQRRMLALCGDASIEECYATNVIPQLVPDAQDIKVVKLLL